MDREIFSQAAYNNTVTFAMDSRAAAVSTNIPEYVIPGEYIYRRGIDNGPKQNPSTLLHVSEQSPLALAHSDNPETNSVNSGWHELVTPPTCQGSLALEDEQKKEWFCGGCHTIFRSRYEAKRHIDTAGMEVRCRYCDKVVNASPFVLNRHVEESSLCLRKWKERGLTGERTVNGAFRA